MRPESEGPQFPVHANLKYFFLSIKKGLGGENGILINSSREIERDGIEILQRDRMTKHGKFYCVGPMIPGEKADRQADDLLLQNKVTAWLDSEPFGSVVYVAMGSVVHLTEHQVTQIGMALQSLGNPFILSLPEPLQRFLPSELEGAIKSQFEGTNSQGLVLRWSPQKTILAHPSVQLFVSHCGWNSVIESVYFGKPVIGWPFFADQLGNALFLKRIGLGISLYAIESSGVAGGEKKQITAEDIIQAVHKIGASSDLNDNSSFTGAAQKWSGKLKATIAPGGSLEAELRKLMEDCTKRKVHSPKTNAYRTRPLGLH